MIRSPLILTNPTEHPSTLGMARFGATRQVSKLHILGIGGPWYENLRPQQCTDTPRKQKPFIWFSPCFSGGWWINLMMWECFFQKCPWNYRGWAPWNQHPSKDAILNDFAHIPWEDTPNFPKPPRRKEFLHKLLVKHPGYLPGVCGWDLRYPTQKEFFGSFVKTEGSWKTVSDSHGGTGVCFYGSVPLQSSLGVWK